MTRHNTSYLRKCCRCGLKAEMEKQLELFVNRKNAPFGKATICKNCYYSDFRVGGKRHNERVEGVKRWAANHPEAFRNKYKRQVSFFKKHIWLRKNIRTNICSNCGKKYPEELKQQTCLHHTSYNPLKPLDNTMELCRSCHCKLHNPKGELNRNWKGDNASPSTIKRRKYRYPESFLYAKSTILIKKEKC